MDRWRHHVAVVTGASSGIGAACVRALLGAGLRVAGLARNLERLERLRSALPQLQQSHFHCMRCNVTLEDEVDRTFQLLTRQLGGIDVLINNAGIMPHGRLLHMSIEDIRDVLNTNFMSAVHCTRSAFRSMEQRSMAGHIIFINSTAGLPGYIAGPHEGSANAYTPSKCALNALHEICRQELLQLKIKIKTTNISPGWVSTNLVPAATKAALGEVILQPENVAEAVMYALSTPPHVQVQEITLRAMGEWY